MGEVLWAVIQRANGLTLRRSSRLLQTQGFLHHVLHIMHQTHMVGHIIMRTDLIYYSPRHPVFEECHNRETLDPSNTEKRLLL